MERLILLIILIVAVACGSGLETVEVHDDNGKLREKFTRKKKERTREGIYSKFYSTGELYEEAEYVNDTLHGKRTIYYENGNPQIVETYARGQFQGVYKAFYENGQLDLEGDYVNGAMTGIWKKYYKTGEPQEEVTFENSEENGPFTEWYLNGKLKAEGNYLNGDNEHGLLKMYDEQGTLVKKMQCDKGICRTIWTLEEGDEKPD